MQTSHISQTPVLTPLSLSHLCTKYLRAQFQNRLNVCSSSASAMPLAQPLMLPVALASELDIIAALLVQAFFDHSQWNKACILTCSSLVVRNGGVGCYLLCREAAEKTFKVRN